MTVTVNAAELREWAGKHADAGHHGVAHALFKAAEGIETVAEQYEREAATQAATDPTLHLAMSTLTRTLDAIVSILGDDAKACEINGEVDPDLMWETLAGGYVPLADRDALAATRAGEAGHPHTGRENCRTCGGDCRLAPAQRSGAEAGS